MRLIARFRPSPALIVASIALFVALAGTSAATVTLIKPNTVASPQVVDGSLQAKDMNASHRRDAFSRLVVGPIDVSSDAKTVASARIPRGGNYVVWAKLYVSPTDAAADVTCDLLAGGSSDRTRVATRSSAPVSLVTTATLTAGRNVDVRCKAQPGAGAKAWVINVTALRVAGLNASRTGSPT